MTQPEKKRAMIQKAISAGLALCLSVSMLALPARAAETLEMTETGASRPVLTQSHVQYMVGISDDRFAPAEQLTRAQGAQIVYRLLEGVPTEIMDAPYTDVSAKQWYALPVTALYSVGLFDGDTLFRPDAPMTRAEFVDLLVRIAGGEDALGETLPAFSDVPEEHWAAEQIRYATAMGWINGYPDGTFAPEKGLTRAEACAVINRMTGRTGDAVQGKKLVALGMFSDVSSSYWAAEIIAEAAVPHAPKMSASGETWSAMWLTGLTFPSGFHDYKGQLYYANRYGNLAMNRQLGAYTAGPTGELSWEKLSYQLPYVPYISQIDSIYAWVGCEPVSALMGLKAKGYAKDVSVTTFLDRLPRTKSDPEKGFVGSPYVPDPTKRTRTTIYPAKLAEYCNSYCNGDVVCSDFRGASIVDLQREVLAGNCVVAYMTLWWASPYYRYYNIEGETQRLVSNNHAVLVYGYDPQKGYLVSDPYNYYNRGKVHQYWENAKTFEAIWNSRKVGMLIR